MILNNILYTFVSVMTFSRIFGEKFVLKNILAGAMKGNSVLGRTATVCAMRCSVKDDCTMFQWDDSKPKVS